MTSAPLPSWSILLRGPPGYFERVQEILRRYDILMIADEVICGFGRTGEMFGCDTFAIKPDIMTVAKALSSAYMPISATVISGAIVEAMRAQSRKLGNFSHGVTYAGHPVAAAVAVETLRIYEERNIVGMVKAVAPHFQARLRALADHPLVGEARGVGLIGAVQLVADKASKTPLPAASGIGPLIQAYALEHGIIVRATPEAVYLCPPLIISRAEIDQLLDGLHAALDAGLAEAGKRGLLAPERVAAE